MPASSTAPVSRGYGSDVGSPVYCPLSNLQAAPAIPPICPVASQIHFFGKRHGKLAQCDQRASDKLYRRPSKAFSKCRSCDICLEIDGQDDIIFVLILFECHGLVPVAIEPLTDLHKRGKKLNPVQSYGDRIHPYNPCPSNFYRIAGCSR